MDPEIVQDHPGSCPKCGMALEPRVPSVSEGPSPELVEMSRRFWISMIFGLPLFVLEMGPMFTGYMPGMEYAQIALATIVVFYCG